MPRPTAPLSLVLAAILGACAATPPPAGDPHGHTHTATVTVTDTGLLPQPLVAIPTFATIVWRNQAESPLTIEVTAASCHECDTVMGFATTESGARSVTVAPGGIATLCFHDAGTFPYVAHVGASALEGVVRVGGER